MTEDVLNAVLAFIAAARNEAYQRRAQLQVALGQTNAQIEHLEKLTAAVNNEPEPEITNVITFPCN
jgi:hypothetical protein